MSIVIDRMGDDDIPQVVGIERSAFPAPWSESLFRREAARTDDGLYLVARSGDVVIGYIGLIKIVDVGHITTLAVTAPERRRGVARSLMMELIRRIHTSGCRYLTLEVRRSNEIAQRLYESLGFTSAGVRPGYYIDNGEDAVIMWSGDIQTKEFAEVLGLDAEGEDV